uniref:Ribosomal protein S3 n=1 Tax=Goniomonas avonlea TaxID=1255295 RepID=A0A348G6L9_9CRYP|nr:ribosomal protein S3 [Goniomonas avonlea]
MGQKINAQLFRRGFVRDSFCNYNRNSAPFFFCGLHRFFFLLKLYNLKEVSVFFNLLFWLDCTNVMFNEKALLLHSRRVNSWSSLWFTNLGTEFFYLFLQDVQCRQYISVGLDSQSIWANLKILRQKRVFFFKLLCANFDILDRRRKKKEKDSSVVVNVRSLAALGLHRLIRRWNVLLVRNHHACSVNNSFFFQFVSPLRLIFRSKNTRVLNTLDLTADFFVCAFGKLLEQKLPNSRKRLTFKSVLITLLKRREFSHLAGIRVQCSGRLTRVSRARSISLQVGKLPLQTLSANLDYSFAVVHTKFGSVGIKAWLYRK